VARITVEDCLDKVDNRFALVLLVAKRAKQLVKGDKPVIPLGNNKQVVSALREVAANKVYFTVDESEQTIQQQIVADLNK
tara:strand:- start:86890 stop:87129 length:240 start_codon:yes stop_codon:yes gene_type:complete